MKIKSNIFAIAAASLVLLTSCGDFFEESSQDEIKPSSTEDLAAVLYREAYPYSIVIDGFVPLLTDEVENSQYKIQAYSSRMEKGFPVYSFDKEMFDGVLSFISDENSWKNYYDLIMSCNVVLDNINNMTGTEDDIRHITGQARALRAYYHFCLANLYALPYDEATAEKNLGVTIMTSSHVSDAYPKRATLKETYKFIEDELIKASQELKDYKPTTVYRVTKTACDILLSRLYLYSKNWDKTIEYATAAISEGPSLTSFPQLRSKYANICDVAYSSEVVWNFNAGRCAYSEYVQANQMTSGGVFPYGVSAKVRMLYGAGDMRYTTTPSNSQCYIEGAASYGFYSRKNMQNAQNDGQGGVRMAEAYLNRAEAYAWKNDKKNSLKDLDDFRTTRYAIGYYNNVEVADIEALKQFILDERQREFVWEGSFRWMDIKRYGLSVTHKFITEEGVESTYTLEANSPLYALPIPREAILKNPELEQNAR